MKLRRTGLIPLVVSFFLLVAKGVTAQEVGDGESGRLAADEIGESTTQDRLGLWSRPEDFMKLEYTAPSGQVHEAAGVQAEGGTYRALYFSDDELLSRFIDAAVSANPAIGESEHRWRAALQQIPQVTALPDPMFSITQFIHKPETRVGPQDQIFSISQKFPWFGKLDARGEMALRDALGAAERVQAQVRDIVASVKRAYYELAYLDEAIRITREDKELLQHFEEIAETRYSTGKGIQQGVIKIQAEITKADDRLFLLGQQRESVAANLNTLMDRPPHEPIPLIPSLSAPAAELDLDRLYAAGRAHRHELKAARYMIEKGDQAVRLAKKEYFPDFTVGLNYIAVDDRKDIMGKLSPPEDNGRDAYSVMLGFNIPLWEGKLMSGVKGARELKQASERGYDAIENAVEFAIRDGMLRAQTSYEQMALYDRVLIPQAEQALDSTEAAYATDKLNALDLIDSERFLFAVRLAYAKLKTDYARALADIELAVGTAFPAAEEGT
jgi:outer membrane protein TolC